MSDYYTWEEICESQDFNHGEKFIEYAHYEICCERIDSLEHQLRDALDICEDEARMEKLQDRLVEAEKVIELYGNSRNWNCDETFIGGRYAREYQRKYKEGK